MSSFERVDACVVGSTFKYREACVQFSHVIALSAEKLAVIFGLLPKFTGTRSIFAIREHCVGIGRLISLREGSVIVVARACFGDKLGEKNSYQLVPGVLTCLPGWLPGPTFLLTMLLIITQYWRAKHNGRGHPRIST